MGEGGIDERMKVILIRTNPINPDVRITKEAETLANAGYDVNILGWDRDKKYPKVEGRSNYTIHRIKLKASFGIKVVLYLPIWWLFELFWLLKEKWDIVHVANFDTFVPALIVAKIKRKPMVYDIFDFYADVMLLPKLSRWIVAAIDKVIMKFADVVIIADKSRLAEIGINANKNIVVITNSPKDIFKNNNTERNKKNDKFVIFYAGGLQKSRHLNMNKIIEAVKKLEDVELVIAGFGDYEKELKEMSKKDRNIVFLGNIPYEEVNFRTLNADLLFALYDPIVPMNRYASPNKLFEAMMCEKPILVSDGTTMTDIVEKENCGIAVDCNSVDEIRNAIVKLKGNLDLCRQLGANGRRAYEQKYNWAIMEQRLLTLYQEL